MTKRVPIVRAAIDRNLATQHPGDQVVNDVQTEATAAPAELGGKERIENARLVRRRNADAVISDGELEMGRRRASRENADASTLTPFEAMQERVVDQIGQCLTEWSRIAVTDQRVVDLIRDDVGSCEWWVAGSGQSRRPPLRVRTGGAGSWSGRPQPALKLTTSSEARRRLRSRMSAAVFALPTKLSRTERRNPDLAVSEKSRTCSSSVLATVMQLPIRVFSSWATPATNEPSAASFSERTRSDCARWSVLSVIASSSLLRASASVRSITRCSGSLPESKARFPTGGAP